VRAQACQEPQTSPQADRWQTRHYLKDGFSFYPSGSRLFAVPVTRSTSRALLVGRYLISALCRILAHKRARILNKTANLASGFIAD
jgi:hypothetical protein